MLYAVASAVEMNKSRRSKLAVLKRITGVVWREEMTVYSVWSDYSL